MVDSYDYEIVVIGAGPGGYVAAIKAAQEGKRTCIIESARFGGTCLNEGCIPTKVFIKTANVSDEIKAAADFAVEGVDPSKITVSMTGIQDRKNVVVNQLVNGVKGLLRSNRVAVINGHAAFLDAHTVIVDEKKVTSEYFIIASGSNALIPGFIAYEGVNHIITSKEALDLEHAPQTIAIIGGGAIGVEFAYLFNKLGSQVAVFELMDHILPAVDPEVAGMAQKRLEKDGVKFCLGVKVKKIKDDCVYYESDGRENLHPAEVILMAVGRAPNTDGLGAEKLGLEFNQKAIRTNNRLQTNLSNIYAIGDVNGRAMLAHTASREGIVAVQNICGTFAEMNYERIPSCIYTEPEIACIGFTEVQAKEKCKNTQIGKFPMTANGKSLIERDTYGVIKVILDGDLNEILGVHLYGKHATDMIGEISVAMAGELTADEIIATVHPHPTISESIPEAFMIAGGKAIHC